MTFVNPKELGWLLCFSKKPKGCRFKANVWHSCYCLFLLLFF
jgi:hypothetical protein